MIRLSLFLLTLILLHSCSPVQISGTSSDVDIKTGMIVGAFVTEAGMRYENVEVQLYQSRASDSLGIAVDTVYTDSLGQYYFPPMEDGIYHVAAEYEDSLFGTRREVIHSEDAVTDLMDDTLFAPGVITGVVLRDEENMMGTAVYIPGTSFTAFTDMDGRYTISRVAPDSGYTLAFQNYGYATTILNDITVNRGDTISIDTVTLVRNQFPDSVSATFDPQSGVVNIQWNRQQRDDITGYLIFRKDPRNSAAQPDQRNDKYICVDTFYSDTLDEELFSQDDTLTLQYQIRSVNARENLSPFSDKAFVTVHTRRNINTPKSISVLSPTDGAVLKGGEEGVIEWKFTGIIDWVTVMFSGNNGKSWYPITYDYENRGEIICPIPIINSDSCLIRVINAEDSLLYADSELFSIESAPETNLIQNGSFNQSLNYWNFILWEGATGTAEVLQGECILQVASEPKEPWHFAFSQRGIPFQQGKTYRLEFDAQSSIDDHLVQFTFQKYTPDYDIYGTSGKVISSEWEHYSLEFTMGHPDDLYSVLLISPGFETATVQLDNITLRIVEE